MNAPAFYTVNAGAMAGSDWSTLETALIGHQTLELLRSDWLNLEPLALDNPRPARLI